MWVLCVCVCTRTHVCADLALRFLDEAADIRARCGRWHYYTALTQQHLGQVCIQRYVYMFVYRIY